MRTPKTHSESKKLTGNGKERLHISLTRPMAIAVNFLGMQLFGSRNGFVEHSLINALEARGISVERILQLAKEYEEEAEKKKEGKSMEGGAE